MAVVHLPGPLITVQRLAPHGADAEPAIRIRELGGTGHTDQAVVVLGVGLEELVQGPLAALAQQRQLVREPAKLGNVLSRELIHVARDNAELNGEPAVVDTVRQLPGDGGGQELAPVPAGNQRFRGQLHEGIVHIMRVRLGLGCNIHRIQFLVQRGAPAQHPLTHGLVRSELLDPLQAAEGARK